VKVIAHRGYAAVAPENTLAAFRAALEAGADALEFDVRLTKDGHPIIMHDAAVDRTTNGHGPVASKTLAQIRALSANRRFAPRFAGEKVPTLDEVLALARGRAMVLAELKDPDRARLPRILAEALARHDMKARALVISFHPGSLVRFRREAPDVPVGLLAYPYDPPARRALAVRADAMLGFFGALDRRVVRATQAAGLEVYTWTVNDRAAMRRAARLGVDGIITDDVGTAREVVAAAAAAGRRR
jgi:glycerophosphoryl diester phosphodiesterase